MRTTRAFKSAVLKVTNLLYSTVGRRVYFHTHNNYIISPSAMRVVDVSY